MNSEMIFMTMVLGIAGIHLLFRLVNLLAKLKGAPVSKTSKVGTRDDWYVFFDRSDLLGKNDVSPVQPDAQTKNTPKETPALEEGHIAQEVYV